MTRNLIIKINIDSLFISIKFTNLTIKKEINPLEKNNLCTSKRTITKRARARF